MLYVDTQELLQSLHGILSLKENDLIVQHGAKLRDSLVDILLENALYSEQKPVRELSRFLIMASARYLGVHPSSLYNLYVARSQGDYQNKTVPLLPLPGMTYEFARAAFAAMKKNDCGLCLFELQKSSSEDGMSETPEDFAAAVLAAAIREGYHGPVFLQLSLSLHDTPTPLLKRAINCGFYNHQLDATRLIEHSNLLGTSNWHKKQERNAEQVANTMQTIHEQLSSDLRLAMGAHVGTELGKLTPPMALTSFMESLAVQLRRLDHPHMDLCKVAVEVCQPKGSYDKELLIKLRDVAISHYQLAGISLHNLSQFNALDYKQLPHQDILEADIAPVMINCLLDSENFPESLTQTMIQYLKDTYGNQWEKGESADDFTRRLRQRCFTPLHKQFWLIPIENKNKLRAELTELFSRLFQYMNVAESTTLVRDNIRPHPLQLIKPKL